MIVADLYTSIGYTLQDTPHNRWTITELMFYSNEGLKDIANRTFAWEQTDTFTMDTLTQAYQLSKVPVKIKSVSTNSGLKLDYRMASFSTIYFDTPKDCTLTVNYYCVPVLIDVLTTSVELTPYMEEALRNFVLYRCYSKDETTENFNKAQLFYQAYLQALYVNISSSNSDIPPNLYQKDFY